MAIFGMLLGISMTVLGWAIYQLHQQKKLIVEFQNDFGGRIAILEKRKSVIAEAAISQPKPPGVGATYRRQWSEDAPAKDAN